MNKEKIKNKKWKKIVISISLIVVIFIAGIIIFISPLTKYFIQKYDKKYLGREVTMDWAYVNPFTGYVHFDNLNIFENENDTVFLSVSGVSANFEMHKLFYKTYEISSLTLNNAKINFIKRKNTFNFNDLILKFSNKDTITPEIEKEPLHLNILKIAINNGEFYFSEPSTPINYSFLKVNFKSDGRYWDRDTINGKLSLISGLGSGFLKSNFSFNMKTLDYRFAALVTDFNLNVTKQYLKDLANFGYISGNFNADVKATGNFKSKEKIDGKGYFIINDFHFGEDSLNDFVSYKKLTVSFKQIAPANKIFLIDSVMLNKPVFKYEKYDYLDNIQIMFGEDGSKIKAVKNNPEKYNLILSVSEYVQTIFKNFFKSDYKINSLAIVDAKLMFNDFSTNEKFSASLSQFNIKADSIDNKKEIVNVYLQSGIKPYGSMFVTLNFFPKNNNFNLIYELKNIPVPLFNPYIISYSSYPLNRGRIELFGNWQVRNEIIQSKNHLIVIDPRISKRIRKKDSKWLPLPLIMFVVKERGNVIDYEIPITGNLKNPKFNFWDVIIDAIKNIFIKPPTTPYRFSVHNTETEIEKSLSLTWQMRQTILTRSQEKFLNKISDFLKDNSEAMITIRPTTFEEKEKEYILFFEAKKKYYLSRSEKGNKNITEDDSLVIEKMSSKDDGFIKYLDKYKNNSKLYTVQDKCYQIVGNNLVNNKFEKLMDSRYKAFLDYFKQEKTSAQIKILSNKNAVPFNGFSDFSINYKGDFPEYLKEASQKLNQFNANAPRDKYKKFRSKKF